MDRKEASAWRCGDPARLGYLLLHEGRWNDEAGEKRIFSPATVERVTRWAPEPQAATCRVPQLGSAGKEGGSSITAVCSGPIARGAARKKCAGRRFYMSGWGKQICCVIPSLDMVIVRLGPKRELNELQDYYAEFLSRVVSAAVKE